MAKRKVNRYEPYEVAWQNREGELIHTIVSPMPLHDADGNYIGSFAVFTDITSRKKAEEDLRFSEEKFAKAFRSSPDAVTITTLKEGRFLDVNEGFLKITGYDRSEVIDHTSMEIDIWPSPEFRRNIMDQVTAKAVSVISRWISASSPGASQDRLCRRVHRPPGRAVPYLHLHRCHGAARGSSARSWMSASASGRRSAGPARRSPAAPHRHGGPALLLENRLEGCKPPHQALPGRRSPLSARPRPRPGPLPGA